MSRLRVARRGGEHFEAGFAKTARIALEQALADGAVVLAITYETPKGETKITAVPNARAVKTGLHEGANALLYPPMEEDE